MMMTPFTGRECPGTERISAPFNIDSCEIHSKTLNFIMFCTQFSSDASPPHHHQNCRCWKYTKIIIRRANVWFNFNRCTWRTLNFIPYSANLQKLNPFSCQNYMPYLYTWCWYRKDSTPRWCHYTVPLHAVAKGWCTSDIVWHFQFHTTQNSFATLSIHSSRRPLFKNTSLVFKYRVWLVFFISMKWLF